MTRAGLLALVSGMAFGAAALLFGLPELLLVALVCGALVLQAIVTVSIRPPLRAGYTRTRRRIQSGTPLEVSLRFYNTARRRSFPEVAIFDEASEPLGPVLRLRRMPAGSVAEGQYHLATDKRGWQQFGPLLAEVEDPFGLARRSHRLLPQRRVLVWPHIDDLPILSEAISKAIDRSRHAPFLGSSVTDFHSLRRFEPGDDPHRIHWPASTRYQELLVRRFDAVERPETLLFLETDQAVASPQTFERMVSAAAGLAVTAARETGYLRLVTSDGREVHARGTPTAVLDALALVGQVPARTQLESQLLASAVGTTLVAVVGEGAEDYPPALDRFGERGIILQFWQDEPAEEYANMLTIGPHQSTTERWDEFQMRHSGLRIR